MGLTIRCEGFPEIDCSYSNLQNFKHHIAESISNDFAELYRKSLQQIIVNNCEDLSAEKENADKVCRYLRSHKIPHSIVKFLWADDGRWTLKRCTIKAVYKYFNQFDEPLLNICFGYESKWSYQDLLNMFQYAIDNHKMINWR